jgi:DMSO/TMAO reductase YedYZ molybdopterin-dependent catalytic subunit
VSQGLHYLAGTACVPLLLVKLYAVYPRLFTRPPRRDRGELVRHGLERVSIGLLVASALFQVVTGTANATQWYPWAFSFRATHYAVAWVAIGALLVHVAVKLPVIRAALRADVAAHEAAGVDGVGLSRRGLLRTTYLATGLVVLSVAGSAVPWLRHVSVFENHLVPGGGVPINTSARRAGVTASATAAGWALEVVHGSRTARLTRADLRSLPQRTERLPIACVEGWSASGEWTGVRLRDLLDLVDAPRGAAVRVSSLQPEGPFRSSTVLGAETDDPLTLVALGLDGAELGIDHGYPCRLIAPGRPGVLQTKWLARIEVMA